MAEDEESARGMRQYLQRLLHHDVRAHRRAVVVRIAVTAAGDGEAAAARVIDQELGQSRGVVLAVAEDVAVLLAVVLVDGREGAAGVLNADTCFAF